MRTIAATMLFLALPSAAHAQFTTRPMPETRYRGPSIEGGAATGASQRGPDRVRGEITQSPEGSRIPTVAGRTSPGAVTFGDELDRARRDIRRHRDSGDLSRSEARALRKEADRIDQMADRYRLDGFSDFERRELDLRASELRNRTATGRHS
jgi:hypothetical protein